MFQSASNINKQVISKQFKPEPFQIKINNIVRFNGHNNQQQSSQSIKIFIEAEHTFHSRTFYPSTRGEKRYGSP